MKGSSTENTLLQMTISAGVDIMRLREQYPLLQIKQRAGQRNFMSSAHAMKPNGRLVAVKGRPLQVPAMCHW